MVCSVGKKKFCEIISFCSITFKQNKIKKILNLKFGKADYWLWLGVFKAPINEFFYMA